MTSSPSRAPLATLGYGLCTPLGLGARVTGAEIAAGTTAFADTEICDRTGEPARASRLSLIPPALDLGSLAAWTIADLAQTGRPDPRGSDRAGFFQALAQKLLRSPKLRGA